MYLKIFSILRLIRFHFKNGVKSKILISGNNIILKRHNPDNLKIVLRVGSTDLDVYYQIFVHLEYQAVIEYIKSKNKSKNIYNIIDAGANIGLTSLYLMKFFEKAEIVLIEPSKQNFDIITKNIFLNNYQNQLFPLQKGLWNKSNKNLKVVKNFRDGREWSFSLIEQESFFEDTIESITIEEIMFNFKFETIDLLKIDIEGAERYIFNDFDSANRFLSKTRFLALEIHDEYNIRDQILKILSKADFDYFHTTELTICFNKKLI